MKNKKFYNDADRVALRTNTEKNIIESFSKTFNKIKRINENEINTVNILDEIVMGAINTNTWELKVTKHEERRLSRRYRNAICHDIDLNISSTFKSFSVTIETSRECDEDPEGASSDMTYGIYIDFIGEESEFIDLAYGENIKDQLSDETIKRLDALVDDTEKETLNDLDNNQYDNNNN